MEASGGQVGYLGCCNTFQGESRYNEECEDPVPTTALDQDSTLLVVLELSAKSWLLGGRVPGLSRYPVKPSVADLSNVNVRARGGNSSIAGGGACLAADDESDEDLRLLVAPAGSRDARTIAGAVGRVTVTWRNEAARQGIGAREIERMASAFEHADLGKVTAFA